MAYSFQKGNRFVRKGSFSVRKGLFKYSPTNLAYDIAPPHPPRPVVEAYVVSVVVVSLCQYQLLIAGQSERRRKNTRV